MVIAVFSLGALLFATAGLAEIGSNDPGVLRQELDMVKTDLETMKKQLSEIQQFLAQRVAQADRGPVTLTVGDGPSLGSGDAPVTIVEFSDYECPFCRRHFSSTFQELKAAYIDTGKVRYVFRDFPLEKIHPDAKKAAEAAHCAGDQGKFWEFHDTLFGHQGALKLSDLRTMATDIKLDAVSFNSCLESGKFGKAVDADLAAGSAAGVNGTPGFFIGKTKPDGTIVATGMKGAQPAAAFSQVIDRLLEEKTP